MTITIKIDSLSHHAYYLVGGGHLHDLHDALIAELNRSHGIKTEANPDFSLTTFETFTIDDARDLKSRAETKPVTEGTKKVSIISMNGITVEAQNALLKLLEEPPEYAHFFLIIPSAHLLLPTVKSRLAFIETRAQRQEAQARPAANGEKSAHPQLRPAAAHPQAHPAYAQPRSQTEIARLAKTFVTLAPSKRLQTVKSLLDEISKEKRPKHDAVEFLNAIEQIVYEEKGPKAGYDALVAIGKARNYASDRAPSLKMLLELVALSI